MGEILELYSGKASDNYAKEQYSERGQDIFAANILKYKNNGTFLDFGCSSPIDNNNTHLFEKNYNFKGLSFDIDTNELNKWKSTNRDCNNVFFCDLSNNFEYALEKIDSFYESNIIDYFSLMYCFFLNFRLFYFSNNRMFCCNNI